MRVLIHIGDACIRKLHELHMHVDKSKNGAVVVPQGCGEVRTVAQMAALMAANRNSHMGEKRLYQGILNMNEVGSPLTCVHFRDPPARCTPRGCGCARGCGPGSNCSVSP